MTPAEERCSMWQWLSIAPGSTSRPAASISRAPAASPRPSAATIPSLIATSHSVVSEAVATVLLRMLYTGSMAGFQVPAGALAERIGGPLLLGLGTALVGIGYVVAGASAGFLMLAVALAVGGLGASTQHPIAATLVAQAFAGRRSRMAFSTYNFSGDLGKMAFPAATAGLLMLMPWRSATFVLGIAALAGAAAILAVRGLPGGVAPAASEEADAARGAAPDG